MERGEDFDWREESAFSAICPESQRLRGVLSPSLFPRSGIRTVKERRSTS